MEKQRIQFFRKLRLMAIVTLIVLSMACTLCGCNISEPAQTAEPAEESAAPVAETAEPVEEAAEPEQEPEPTPWRENPLDAISLSAEDKRSAYDEYDAALMAAYEDGTLATAAPEDVEAAEAEVAESVAANYGITSDELNSIYMYGAMGYLYDVNPAELSVSHGDLLEATITGNTLVVKAKISPSMTNKMTIDQNYMNVCDLISKQGCADFNEIQYWAVADMTDGSESKVISFTVHKDCFGPAIENGEAAYTFLTYEDLWILPSLEA